MYVANQRKGKAMPIFEIMVLAYFLMNSNSFDMIDNQSEKLRIIFFLNFFKLVLNKVP